MRNVADGKCAATRQSTTARVLTAGITSRSAAGLFNNAVGERSEPAAVLCQPRPQQRSLCDLLNSLFDRPTQIGMEVVDN